MSVAQRLYEGVDTPDGHIGLITYMRTDSVQLSGQALGEAREVIRDRYGDRYTMPKGRVYRTKAATPRRRTRPSGRRRSPAIRTASRAPWRATRRGSTG